mmetsp:Transcript_42086/g.91723  ORF Transcript_42086/g.91723 Transcript_42086/m.91723 type:complete len:218 (-) Transcript_42086:358-1011(-)
MGLGSPDLQCRGGLRELHHDHRLHVHVGLHLHVFLQARSAGFRRLAEAFGRQPVLPRTNQSAGLGAHRREAHAALTLRHRGARAAGCLLPWHREGCHAGYLRSRDHGDGHRGAHLDDDDLADQDSQPQGLGAGSVGFRSSLHRGLHLRLPLLQRRQGRGGSHLRRLHGRVEGWTELLLLAVPRHQPDRPRHLHRSVCCLLPLPPALAEGLVLAVAGS